MVRTGQSGNGEERFRMTERNWVASIGDLDCYEGLGVRIWHDRLDREEVDNVMGIFHEEQVLTWKLLGTKLIEAIEDTSGSIDFLDVGAGSGFWGVLVAKNIRERGRVRRIVAVDRVGRALEICKRNMRENGVNFELKLQQYSIDVAPKGEVRAAFMNPPYHIYPEALESRIPYHARSGGLGFEEFINWLAIADYHLSDRGSVFFHHMCLGADEPEFLRFIPLFISGKPSILYYEILPSIDTLAFLKEVYPERFASFSYRTAIERPSIYFASGIIVKDGLGRRDKRRVSADLLNGKSWQDRIALHRSIAEMTYSSKGSKVDCRG